MKKIFLLIVGVWLFGANLIGVDFFPHKNFLDILLSFDSKFNGNVTKLSKEKYLIKGVDTGKEYVKNFDFSFLKSVKIIPVKNGIEIDLKSQNNPNISFAMTPEGYGVRIRVKNSVKTVNTQNNLKNLMAQNPENSIDYFTYFIILAILVILAIILWILRKKVSKLPVKKSDITMGVILQKPIDAKNKIVLFDFNGRKYLMLVGNTNLLLDVFDENLVHVSTPKEFDDYLKLNSKMDEVKKYIKNAEELKDFDERI